MLTQYTLQTISHLVSASSRPNSSAMYRYVSRLKESPGASNPITHRNDTTARTNLSGVVSDCQISDLVLRIKVAPKQKRSLTRWYKLIIERLRMRVDRLRSIRSGRRRKRRFPTSTLDRP